VYVDFSGGSQVRDEGRWYVVHTRPHREAGAARQLECQGFRVFLPLHHKTIRHARRFKTVRAPFFPRYLFVGLNIARERWRSVNGTFGVSGLIMEGAYPKPVPTGIVESLAAIGNSDGTISFAALLQPGQSVRILTGPFADRVGQLLNTDEQDRVRILLDVMGASFVVHSSGAALAPAA
jgi:transcription elongation factor/antiterminator RfaH